MNNEKGCSGRLKDELAPLVIFWIALEGKSERTLCIGNALNPENLFALETSKG